MATHASDENGIREAIRSYSEGIRTGNIDTLRAGFHPQAVMSGEMNGQAIVTPIQGLYDYVTSVKAPQTSGEPYSCSVDDIQITGNVAAARVSEKSYQGHDFSDFFHLLKVDGRWLIVSKAFNVA